MRGCASGLWNSLTPTLVVVFMAVVFMVVFIMLVFMVVFIMLVFMVVFIMLVFIVIFLSTPPFRTPLHRFIWVLTFLIGVLEKIKVFFFIWFSTFL